MRFSIHGGTSLMPRSKDGPDWSEADITLAATRIERLAATRSETAHQDGDVFDATDLLVLPGIVDIHGDAFERQIQPRSQTVFAHDVALADTDRQLVANGITTACHGLTYSWEGGLRGREAALALMEQVALQRRHAHADHRIHLRFENHHVDGVSDVLNWINDGKIDFLAFNEHLPSIAVQSAKPEKMAAYAERARCSAAEFTKRLTLAQSRTGEVEQAVALIAAACRARSIPMASHDDETCAEREHFQAFGVTVSEFPRTLDALLTAMVLDNQVVMGAPNVLLGGSHCGGLSAVDAVKSGMCDILASDYYYPSLFHAAFKLANVGTCSLAHAWRLIAENPAAALGLRDRGLIAEGCRADLVLVEPSAAGSSRLVATIAAGKLVYCAEPNRLQRNHRLALAA